MRKAAFVAVAALGLIASSIDFAAAADGCGRGRFYNGHRCVPQGDYYGGPRAYYGGGGGWYRGPDMRGRPDDGTRFIPRRERDGRLHCPESYTVQDGVCKPYRGY